MKKYCLTLACFFMILSLKAQPDLIKATGEIPKEFLTPSTTKYKKQVEEWEKNNSGQRINRYDRKNQKQFILESGFGIDDILQSGMVLFNDPATVYVNQILNQLPWQDVPALKNKHPRVYTLNSSSVNAFATDQGIIFVSLGLLAHLENEAQLAFILAHELIHVQHEHALDKFVTSKSIERDGSKNLKDLNINSDVFSKSLYSQTLEEEADAEGIELFLKTDYDPKAVLKTFRILYYSYIPLGNQAFEKSFLEDEHYQLTPKLWLGEVNEVSPMDNHVEAQAESTHPSSIDRLLKLRDRISNIDNTNKTAFLVSETTFKAISKKARYQIPFLELYSDNYIHAIYTANVLRNEFPNDIHLKKLIGKALYMEAKYQNYDEEEESGFYKSDLKGISAEIEGEIQRAYYLFAKIDIEELTTIALKYNWNLAQTLQDDYELQMLLDDAFKQFAVHFKNLDDFSSTAPPTGFLDSIMSMPAQQPPPVIDSTEIVLNAPADTSSSTVEIDFDVVVYDDDKEDDKINTGLSATERAAGLLPNYLKYALVSQIQSDSFETAFQNGLKAYQEDLELDDFYDSSEGYRYLKDLQKKWKKKGKSLDLDKIVVVNPFYLSIDWRNDGKTEFIRSEKKQIQFLEAVNTVAKRSKLKSSILDVGLLKTPDIDQFNDLVTMNQYFNQQMDYYDLSLSPGYEQNAVNAVSEKYDTDYFLWMGVIAVHEKHGGWPLSILVPSTYPFVIANRFSPQYDMMFYAILFDVKTGRRSVIKTDYYNKRDHQDIIKAHIYDVFHQIEKEK